MRWICTDIAYGHTRGHLRERQGSCPPPTNFFDRCFPDALLTTAFPFTFVFGTEMGYATTVCGTEGCYATIESYAVCGTDRSYAATRKSSRRTPSLTSPKTRRSAPLHAPLRRCAAPLRRDCVPLRRSALLQRSAGIDCVPPRSSSLLPPSSPHPPSRLPSLFSPPSLSQPSARPAPPPLSVSLALVSDEIIPMWKPEIYIDMVHPAICLHTPTLSTYETLPYLPKRTLPYLPTHSYPLSLCLPLPRLPTHPFLHATLQSTCLGTRYAMCGTDGAKPATATLPYTF
eukprot:2397072-Rhodomonas_salina.1